MNQTNAPLPTGDEEEDLNRAIDELRGVLHENTAPSPDDAAGAAIAGGVADEAPATSFATETAASPVERFRSSVIMNIPVEVQIVLGSAEMQIADLMNLRKGAIVALNRRIGEAVDVVVNGRAVARGEITVLETDASRFGIRLTEIITNEGS
jgi:flagellar motor switch protein FliN